MGKLVATVDFEVFRAELVAAQGPRDRAKGGRPPFDPVLKFRMLTLQAMHGLLGMKGTMSEMELSVLRQRSVEALRQKARRGELFLNVAIGYVKVRRDRIAKDPDRCVQEAIELVLRKFAEFQSIR